MRQVRETAEILARKTHWSPLYDADRLRSNNVPVGAVAYYNDMFVEFELSEDTYRAISDMKLWITNEYTHSGLRNDPSHVLDRLRSMVRGSTTHEE